MKRFENTDKGGKFDGSAYKDVVPSKSWSEAVRVSLCNRGGKHVVDQRHTAGL